MKKAPPPHPPIRPAPEFAPAHACGRRRGRSSRLPASRIVDDLYPVAGLLGGALRLGVLTLAAALLLPAPGRADPPAASPADAPDRPLPPGAPQSAPGLAPAAPAQSARLANASSRVETRDMDQLDDRRRLVVGDVVGFRIVEDGEDARSLTIADSGDLEVPGLGRFPAAGRTCRRLAFELKAALETNYYYQATVLLAVNTLARSRGRVYLVGPVRLPGPQELPGDEVATVGKAILRAGGFTDFADRRRVQITRPAAGPPARGGPVTFTVDVGRIYDAGRTDLDVALEPGDFIYVPERLVRF